MFSHKILFLISLLAGILILGIGLIMYFGGAISGGYTWGRDGAAGNGSLSGTGTIFLGISALLFSLNLYFWYKKIAKERQQLLDDEIMISNNVQDKKGKMLAKQAYIKRFKPGK